LMHVLIGDIYILIFLFFLYSFFLLFFFFFFFKQKTAYEIGLGIPAEPLFRSRKIILIKQELLLLVYELNRSGLLAENEKIRPILAQLEKLLLCDLSPSTNDSVKN